MGKSDKTKDEGIIGARNEHIDETECCADGACCWNSNPTNERSKGDKGGGLKPWADPADV